MMHTFFHHWMISGNQRCFCQLGEQDIGKSAGKNQKHAQLKKAEPTVLFHNPWCNHQVKIKPMTENDNNANQFQKYRMALCISRH